MASAIVQPAITFDAQITKVTTRVDRSFSVTLNLPEYCAWQAAAIMQMQNAEVEVSLKLVAMEPSESSPKQNGNS